MPQIRFGRDVLPILSENCLSCHGPDESNRKAGLRLDTREGALAAISLVEPTDSELLRRVLTNDTDELMPPESSHKKRLSKTQIDTLRRWIAEGATWGMHWSFEPPVRPVVPSGATHPIDAFIREQLEVKGLGVNPTAAPHTLLRRLSFDLTGLPPTDKELATFLHDCQSSADEDPSKAIAHAYERAVDRLLNSPHYGERMAMWWLDAARYADTDGFQGEETRTNWPWRDWVVDAFNGNMKFNQFTKEQFAGDLIPNATLEQRLATCFHRNHMTNGEGGRDPEESRIDYVIDRVNSVGTVWLGLTLGCCQCHSHKYDPISHADYYSLSAFFDSINEDGRAGRNAIPYLSYASPKVARALDEAKQLVEIRKPRERASKAAAQAPMADWLEQRKRNLPPDYKAWRPLQVTSLQSVEGTELNLVADDVIAASGPNPNQDDYRIAGRAMLPRITAVRLEILPHKDHSKGKFSRGATGEFILTDIKVQARRPGNSQIRDIAVSGAVADVSGEQNAGGNYGDVKGILDDDPRNGWTTQGHDSTQSHMAVIALEEPLVLEPDEELLIELRQRSTIGDANIGRFRISITDEAGPTRSRVTASPLEELALSMTNQQEISSGLQGDLFSVFLADYKPYQVERKALDRAVRQLQEVEAVAKPIDVMVLSERAELRKTHVLLRGVWDKKGDVVKRSVPSSITPWQQPLPSEREPTRMDLAEWLVDRRNPLTARVIMNHLWQLMFGAGLVRTADDFGLQGERPTHPELLDWLAVEFMEHDWDVKFMLKLIVTSQTYQQSSDVSSAHLATDPENRWLARGPRYRLPSWMLRDAALVASGLLNPAIGGPPVKPFQPDGVWEEMFMGRFRYEPSEGSAQYRRTLYAFWRRAIAPTFLFDSAQRRVCEVRQSRTNTPLQALTLMNDRNYTTAAVKLAADALKHNRNRPSQFAFLCRRILSREPVPSEIQIMSREYDKALEYYTASPKEAQSMLDACGLDTLLEANPSFQLDAEGTCQHAAMYLITSLVFNLDEAINRE